MSIEKKQRTAEEALLLIDELYEKEEKSEDYYNPEQLRKNISEQIYFVARDSSIGEEEKECFKNEYIEALLNYGTYEKGLRRTDIRRNIIKHFERAIQLNPDLPIAYYRLAHMHYTLEDFSAALHNFLLALEKPSQKFKRLNLDALQKKTAEKFAAYLSLMFFKTYKDNALKHDKYNELNQELVAYETSMSQEIMMDKPIKCTIGDSEPFRITEDKFLDYLDSTDMLVIDRYSNQHALFINMEQLRLTSSDSELLANALLDESQLQEDLLSRSPSTNRKRVSRLRKKIVDKFNIINDDLLLKLHHSESNSTQPSLLFKSKLKFVILSKPSE